MKTLVNHYSCFFKITSVLICILVVNCDKEGPSLSATDPTVEYLTNPDGLDVHTPRFSWKLESPVRGVGQSAYRIIVSENREHVANEEGEVWDTGKVKSEQSLNIIYEGESLESGGKYYWRVRVWDQGGKPGSWSETQHFQMGLLNPADWQADWITTPDSTVSSPLFRSEFAIEKEIESATAFVTGAGYYELYLNGEKIGDHVLDPAMTDFRKRMLYESYDVTDKLQEGENAWGLWLGNGAYRLKAEEGRWTWYGMNNQFGTPMGLVQMHIMYKDGAEEITGSDAAWKTAASPIAYNNVYGGEDYDARLEQEGWNSIGFDDSSWEPVKIVENPDIIMDSQVMPPIRVVETIQPVTQTTPEPGTYLYDLEQNIPGWWRLKMEGERGTEIKIRAAETLNDSLFPTPLQPDDSLSTNQAYHRDVWTTYTLKGEGVETYEPRFFYTGFRYVEVQIKDPERIHSLEIEGRVVHSDLERNGKFSSSDTLLNRIYDAAIWSQRGNWHGYPEDCPHREKGGYNGDGQVIAETSIHDFHMHAFYEKWVNDMRDAQFENGRIPNTSPTILGGTGGGIAWGSVYILLPWWMYQYYGDLAILEDHYSNMKEYMGYLQNLAASDEVPEETYIINEFGGHWDSLGEWAAPMDDRNNGPVNPLTNTYYWYLNTLTFADIAGALGREEDRKSFLTLADSIKEAFHEKFFLPEENLYGTEELYQGYLLFALNGNLVPEDHRQAVLDNLIHDIEATSNGHLGTGILGTKHLFNVLAEEGREDVLHQVVTKKTFPSWGYWIENGATTLWESWNGGGSHNHQMFGTVNEYFYKYLAGIRAPTNPGTSTGYQTIHFKPFVPEDLDYVEASVETIRGRVVSHWQNEEGGLKLDVSVPVSSRGKVSIPMRGLDPMHVVISESGREIWSEGQFVEGVEGISTGRLDGDYITFEITSGTYVFELGSL